MKILITGSHFTPAQAVIEELKKNVDCQITYVGRKYTMEGDRSLSAESQILPKLGVKFVPIITGRLQKTLTVYTLPSLLKIPVGFLQSFYILLKERPDAVLSFGGYVSVPMIISAWMLSIPIILHEQTLVSGLASQIGAVMADKIAVSFLENEFSKNRKVVLTGNPIRHQILEPNDGKMSDDISEIIDLYHKEKLLLVLIICGNQGSHLINRTVSEILEKLTEISCVIHQTGDSKFKDFETAQKQRETLEFVSRYLPVKWVTGDDMGKILQNADLVISRGGINTLLELAYSGTPALVIPIPYIYKDEQNVNARFFQKTGLAAILPQENLNAENLLQCIKKMVKNLSLLKKDAQKAKQLVIPDAAKRLALETILLAQKRSADVKS